MRSNRRALVFELHLVHECPVNALVVVLLDLFTGWPSFFSKGPVLIAASPVFFASSICRACALPSKSLIGVCVYVLFDLNIALS